MTQMIPDQWQMSFQLVDGYLRSVRVLVALRPLLSLTDFHTRFVLGIGLWAFGNDLVTP
jgi:hypothetical protein